MIYSSNILSFYWSDQPSGSTIRLKYKKYTSIFKDSVNFIRKLIRDVCFAFIFFYVVDLRFSASLSALAVIIFNLSFQMNLNTLSSLDSNAAWFNKMMFGPENHSSMAWFGQRCQYKCWLRLPYLHQKFSNNSPWLFIFQQSDGNRLSISNEHRYFETYPIETNPIGKVLCDDVPK